MPIMTIYIISVNIFVTFTFVYTFVLFTYVNYNCISHK